MAKMLAKLYSDTKPSAKRFAEFSAFLTRKYGECELEWVKSDMPAGAFRLEAGSDIYDWTAEGRMRQLGDELTRLVTRGDVIPLMREAAKSWKPEARPEEIGRVLSVGDGIVTASGLDRASYGEIVVFECGVKGMVQDLHSETVGIIVFGDDRDIAAGSLVHRTGKTAGIPVGKEFLGRVVDALGNPVDGLGEIRPEAYRPIEFPAPGITARQPVMRPLETGLLVIDSMFPIGRGQRELIIGDRQTGKTSIALDTILNQKGKDVICIYVAIGQKSSSVVQTAEFFRKYGADKYTVIMTAGAGESAPMQYIAPYAGTALAEHFMYAGRDVLIIYDDLSKHAVAYRALSLLLERAPGREAYPGDVFYLHSRLLERAAHLSPELGGGSITALPIVETQAGDVSAYIPTNVISITDGQIFLESELFFEGQRPAVNIGLSVSRVGSAAQTQAVKSAVGSLRLDLAQYREMEVFMQFASDLDDLTKKQLFYGQGLMRLLRQQRGRPYSQTDEVLLLVSALAHTMKGVAADSVADYAQKLLAHFKAEEPALCAELESGTLTDAARQKIVSSAEKFNAAYNAKKEG